jgi:hypothetical protein
MDEVIPTVNQFAMDINEKIMGRYIKPPVVAGAAAGVAASKGPGALTAVGEDFEGEGIGSVQGFKVQIVSLDVGDVDGDGKKELVFVDKSKVYVYRWKEKSFALVKTIEGGMSAEYIYANVADLDRNTSGSVSSFVLEWDGNTFKKIIDRQRWLLRVIDVPEKGKTLIGQRRVAGGRYSGKVQFLRREGKNWSPQVPLIYPALPKSLTSQWLTWRAVESIAPSCWIHPIIFACTTLERSGSGEAMSIMGAV